MVCFLVGAGWPATLLAGGNEIGRGLVILGRRARAARGLAERPSRLALVAAAAVLVGAFALSSSPAVAKDAFLDWQHWDFYTRAAKACERPLRLGCALQRRPVPEEADDGPNDPRTAHTAVLARDGARQLRRHALARAPVARDAAREPRAALLTVRGTGISWIEQDVTVAALQDDHLVGASIPICYECQSRRLSTRGRVCPRPGGLHRDQHYFVTSYSPRPTPARARPLVRADYPDALTKPGRELDVSRGVTVPPFGEPGRDARVLSLFSGRLQPYAEVFKRRKGRGRADDSPYAVAVALEALVPRRPAASRTRSSRADAGTPAARRLRRRHEEPATASTSRGRWR